MNHIKIKTPRITMFQSPKREDYKPYLLIVMEKTRSDIISIDYLKEIKKIQLEGKKTERKFVGCRLEV